LMIIQPTLRIITFHELGIFLQPFIDSCFHFVQRFPQQLQGKARPLPVFFYAYQTLIPWGYHSMGGDFTDWHTWYWHCSADFWDATALENLWYF